MQNWMLGIVGIAGGFLVSSGLVAFLLSLGIVPRYAGISNTGFAVNFYEDCLTLGTVWGSLAQSYDWGYLGGYASLVIYGICSGVFLGGWSIALAETLQIYPIMFRRLKISGGTRWIICAVDVGKALGTWYFFMKGMG
jgi:stage V sporulation protein AB